MRSKLIWYGEYLAESHTVCKTYCILYRGLLRLTYGMQNVLHATERTFEDFCLPRAPPRFRVLLVLVCVCVCVCVCVWCVCVCVCGIAQVEKPSLSLSHRHTRMRTRGRARTLTHTSSMSGRLAQQRLLCTPSAIDSQLSASSASCSAKETYT